MGMIMLEVIITVLINIGWLNPNFVDIKRLKKHFNRSMAASLNSMPELPGESISLVSENNLLQTYAP